LTKSLSEKVLFLFDLDGVFYKGKENRVKLGGSKIIESLRTRQKKIFILTNDSTDSIATIRSRLGEFDIDVSPHEILSSARLTAEFLRSRFGRVKYYLIGESGLEDELRSFGHTRTKGESADCVIVGLDRELTYEKLDHAVRLVRGGSSIVATHAAKLYMYRNGPALATGPVVKAIEFASGKRAITIGKPASPMFKMALDKAGCTPKETVMVGDQIETDILGASKLGIDSVLVTSGVDKTAGKFKVIVTIPNVDDLANFLV